MTLARPFRLVAALAFALFAATGAHAQLFRAYVSLSGHDANACTLVAPCRLLPAALNAVADGGEIWMLDSANYNTAPVTIAKSVTILAIPGSVGSVVANGGPAIVANTAGIAVTLRNLVIVPLPGNTAQTGIVFGGTGASMSIQESEIAGFSTVGGHGINASGDARLFLVNSLIRHSSHGILTAGGVHTSVGGSRFIRNTVAVRNNTSTSAVSHTTVSDSFLAGNFEGIVIQGSGATNAISRATVTRTTITDSTFALAVDAGPEAGALASLTLNASTVSNNVTAVFRSANNAVAYSHGNNQVTDNATTGPLTLLALQ